MHRTPVFLALSLTVLLVSLALGLSVGSSGILSPARALESLLVGQVSGVLQYRLIRTLAAALLGAGLAGSGLTLQYTLRNPMADPYLLGVSTGAAFGVVLVYVVNPMPHPLLVYWMGLLWGLIAFLIVVGLGAYMGAGPNSLIVAGVSVGYGFFGLIVLLMARSPEAQRLGFTWLFGTVAYVTRQILEYTAAIVAAATAGMALLSRALYTLILGDEVAESLGVNVARLRLAAVTLASLASSALVAMSGPVGFIGLAAPWAVRLTIGSRYSTALAASLLLGASTAILSDVAVRIVGRGAEIPLTAVTAIFGAPVLFYLSRRTGW